MEAGKKRLAAANAFGSNMAAAGSRAGVTPGLLACARSSRSDSDPTVGVQRYSRHSKPSLIGNRMVAEQACRIMNHDDLRQ